MQRTESFIKTIKRFIDNISKIKNGQAFIKIKTGHGRFKQISVKIDKNFWYRKFFLNDKQRFYNLCRNWLADCICFPFENMVDNVSRTFPHKYAIAYRTSVW